MGYLEIKNQQFSFFENLSNLQILKTIFKKRAPMKTFHKNKD